jgi:hypothetical protein
MEKVVHIFEAFKTIFYLHFFELKKVLFELLKILKFIDIVTLDICDEDWEKCDYVRSISKKTRQGLD